MGFKQAQDTMLRHLFLSATLVILPKIDALCRHDSSDAHRCRALFKVIAAFPTTLDLHNLVSFEVR